MEFIQIPKEHWDRIEAKLDRAIEFIEAEMEVKSKWLKQSAAMKMIGCGKTKIAELREANTLTWRYAGEGTRVMILRASIEKYIQSQSSSLKIA